MSASLTAAAGPAPGAPRTRRAEALPVVVGAAVALLPFLIPAGPGNTAVADAAIAGCLLVAAMWVSRERLPIALPYSAGVALLVVGGAFAATVSNAPLSTTLVLAQDIFLLLWAATLALGRHDPAVLSAATVTWCRVAVVYSAVVIVAYVIGFGPLSGVTGENGVRASYTFGDPNLAGNYLVTSLFLMLACQRPRAASTRRVGYALVLVALSLTGSNGAMLTLMVGLVGTVAVSRYRHRGALAGLLSLSLATAVAAAGMLLVLPRVDFDGLRAQASNSVPLLRDSFGRSGGSASERRVILEEGTGLYLEGDAIGVGPGRTKATLEAAQAPYVKEAHNDYLATLLERGLVGALGLGVLVAAVAGRCWRLLNCQLPTEVAHVVPRYYQLVALAPALAVAASFYEVLHFRHVWTWLGIVAALVLSAQGNERRIQASLGQEREPT